MKLWLDELPPWPDFQFPAKAIEAFSASCRVMFAEFLRQFHVARVRLAYRPRSKPRRSTVRRMRRKWHGG